MEDNANVTCPRPETIPPLGEQSLQILPVNRSTLLRDFFLLTYGEYSTSDISLVCPAGLRTRRGFDLRHVRHLHVSASAISGAVGGSSRVWALSTIYYIPFTTPATLRRSGDLALATLLVRFTTPADFWVEVTVYARVSSGNWLFVGVSEGLTPSLAHSGLVAACELAQRAFRSRFPEFLPPPEVLPASYPIRSEPAQ